MGTRDMDESAFADRMRERRGQPPTDASPTILESGCSATGDDDWMCWVVVSDHHPWYGEAPDECTDGGQLNIELLLNEGERAESMLLGASTAQGWMISAFVCGEGRARQLLKHLVDAANAAVTPRLSGSVVSSR